MNARAAIRRTCVIAVFVGAALLTACSRSPAAPAAVFEIAEVVPAGTPGALALSPWIASSAVMHVAEPARFAIERAQVQPGPLGDPALLVESTEADRAAFHDWTSARVGRSVAFLADQQVLCVAPMHGALPGGGLVDFGSDKVDPTLLRHLAERLAPTR